MEKELINLRRKWNVFTKLKQSQKIIRRKVRKPCYTEIYSLIGCHKLKIMLREFLHVSSDFFNCSLQ